MLWPHDLWHAPLDHDAVATVLLLQSCGRVVPVVGLSARGRAGALQWRTVVDEAEHLPQILKRVEQVVKLPLGALEGETALLVLPELHAESQNVVAPQELLNADGVCRGGRGLF